MYLQYCRLEGERTQRFPFTIPSLAHFERLEFPTNVTFFVGENGSGKSTLLEGIADRCDFNTAGGGRNHLYEVHKAEAVMGEHLRLAWGQKVSNGFFLRAETFYQFAEQIDKLESPYKYASLYLSNRTASPF